MTLYVDVQYEAQRANAGGGTTKCEQAKLCCTKWCIHHKRRHNQILSKIKHYLLRRRLLISSRICATHLNKTRTRDHAKQTVITPRTKRVIKIISCSREHMYKVFTGEQLYIYISASCMYIYIHIYIYTRTHRRKFEVQHDASEKCTTKQTPFSAKSGECHVFPLPIAPSRISSGNSPHSGDWLRAYIISSETRACCAPSFKSSSNLPRDGASPKFE